MWSIVLTILNSSQQSSKKENGIFQIGNSTWLTTVNAHHPSSPLSAPLKAGNHLGSLFKWPLSTGGPREPTMWSKETSAEGRTCSKGLWRKLVELPCPLWLWHIPAPGRKSRAETGRPWGWVTRKETASILKPTAAEQWKPCEAIFVWLQQLIEPGGANSARCLPSISLTKRGTLFPCQKPVSLSCLRMIKMPLCSFMCLSQKEFIARQKDSNWKMARALLLLSFHCCSLKLNCKLWCPGDLHWQEERQRRAGDLQQQVPCTVTVMLPFIVF